jgi:hypothetical protein
MIGIEYQCLLRAFNSIHVLEKHEKLLNMLMDFNPLVRFTAICTPDGEIEWSSQRDNVSNIMPLEETKSSIKRAAESWKARRRRSANGAGRGMYTITAYEKIKRITIPLDDEHVLFISTNNEPEKKEGYGKLVGMGEIMSIVDFINKNN